MRSIGKLNSFPIFILTPTSIDYCRFNFRSVELHYSVYYHIAMNKDNQGGLIVGSNMFKHFWIRNTFSGIFFLKPNKIKLEKQRSLK